MSGKATLRIVTSIERSSRTDVMAITEFHAHIYYSKETRDTAVALREALQTMAGGRLKTYTLADGPRGPHVTPMFGVDNPVAD